MPRYLLLAAVLAVIQTCGRADDEACNPPFTDLKGPKYYRTRYTGCDSGKRFGGMASCNCYARMCPPEDELTFNTKEPTVYIDCSFRDLAELNPPSFEAAAAATPSPTFAGEAEYSPFPTPAPSYSPSVQPTLPEKLEYPTFPEAHVIYANGNALTHLAAGTFGNQPKLRKLYLHDNRALTSIEAGAFSNMTELRYLLLHYTALESLPPGVFDGLPKLKILWLHNTALRRVPADAFLPLTHLRQLRLANNNLSLASLDPAASALWPATLDVLDLTGNPALAAHPYSVEDEAARQRTCCSFCNLPSAALIKAATFPDPCASWSDAGPCEAKFKLGSDDCCGTVCPHGCANEEALCSKKGWQIAAATGSARAAWLASLALSLACAAALSWW